MKKYLADYALLFLVAGCIVLLDQYTKFLVRTNLAYSEMWAPWPWLLPYVRIVHWQNTGAAFGIFQNLGGVFTVLAIVVSGAILYYFPQVPRNDWPLRLALCLQFGGAVGNLVDRVTRGTVTDFISVGNFAVWNVADASITMGVVILVLSMWFKDRKKPAQENAPDGQDGPPAGESAKNPRPEEARGE